MKENKWLRHGDVILKRVDKVGQGLKKVAESVLAEGEISGHFHRLKGQVLEGPIVEGVREIEILSGGAVLSHEEHDTLEIPEGKYQVMIQREVDLMGEVRQVMD